MATKTDAKSQRTQYTYDSYADLIQVSRGTVSGGVFTEDVGQRVNYTYGAQGAQNNSAGRVTNITYGPLISISEGYRYTAPGQVSRKSLSVGSASSLNVSYTYDNEGRMLTITYPGSAQYTYGFDAMGRLNTMTTSGGSLVSGVTYNTANQVLSIAGLSESRTYNSNGQLTNLTSGSYHYAYNYSGTQNNGRITSMQDVASGETITYAYDSLNRLIGASGAGDPQGSWSQTFSYDGFGNLLSKIGNNAPNVTSYTVNAATNRMTSNGAVYDANGNMTANGTPGQVTSFGYDEANRLSGVTPPGNPTNNSQATYSYDTANQRVCALIQTTVNSVYTANYYIYFYGADGKKLGVWQLTNPYSNPTLTVLTTNLWFGGRLIQRTGVTTYEDRLQSVGKYFPYGEDRYNPTPANPSNDQEKFGTYTRDSISGLDYALNRYYGAGMGRFMSADPYVSTAGPREPQGWNRYPYAQGDPVNRYDPKGLFACDPDDPDCGFCDPDLDPYCAPCPDPEHRFGIRPAFGEFGGGDCGDQGPVAPDARCSISVESSGTPLDGQTIIKATTYSPFNNQLGKYSTIGRPGGVPQAWFFAVQIHVNLFGDTDPNDWIPMQTKALSGTFTIFGRPKTIAGGSGSSPDNPDIGINYSTKGHFDWFDEPGIPSYFDGFKIEAADLTYRFTSTLENGAGASCSVSWSVHFTLARVTGKWDFTFSLN